MRYLLRRRCLMRISDIIRIKKDQKNTCNAAQDVIN